MVKKIIKTASVIIFGSLLSIVTGILLSRVLGPANYGIYNFIISSTTIVYILIVAGWAMLLNREIPTLLLLEKYSDLNGLIKLSQIHVLALSILYCSIVFLLIKLDWLDMEYGAYFIIALGIIPVKTLSNVYTSILNALKNPVSSQVILTVITPLIVLITALLLYKFDSISVSNLLVSQIASWSLALIISYILICKKLKRLVTSVKKTYKIRSWYTSLLPFALMAIMQTVNIEIATVILGVLGTEESVGYFKVSMQGVSLLALGLGAINIVTAPHIATLFRSNKFNETQQLLNRSVKLVSFVGFTAAAILILFGKVVIGFLFGDEYSPSYIPMVILSVAYVMVFLMGTVTVLLNMTGNERSVLKTISISLILNIILLLILVPLYEEIGAAISVSIGLVLWTFLMMIKAYRLTGFKTWLRLGE